MSAQAPSFYIKTNRAFSSVRRYAWVVTLLIAIGGQFVYQLGLAVPFIMLALILMSLFKGKYWCGNFCPHGSFFDVVIQPWSRQTKIPEVLRSPVLIGAVLLFFMYQMTARFLTVWPALGTATFWEQLGFVFSNTYLMVLLVGGFLGLIISPRAWCQFCPMGTMELLCYKLGKLLGFTQKYDEKVTIEDPALCHSCGKCARVCPIQLFPYLNFSDDNQLDDERCIRCNTCVQNCPADILHLTTEDEAKKLNESGKGAAG